MYSKPCVKRPLSKRPKMFFKTNYHLMQVKSIAECSKGSILQNIRPSLSYLLPLIPLFCLFLSGPEYEQESSNTITHCRPTHGTGRKSHRTQTVTSHVRIQEFFSFFFSPQLILQRSNIISLFKVPEGVQYFPVGGPTFARGGPIAYSL